MEEMIDLNLKKFKLMLKMQRQPKTNIWEKLYLIKWLMNFKITQIRNLILTNSLILSKKKLKRNRKSIRFKLKRIWSYESWLPVKLQSLLLRKDWSILLKMLQLYVYRENLTFKKIFNSLSHNQKQTLSLHNVLPKNYLMRILKLDLKA